MTDVPAAVFAAAQAERDGRPLGTGQVLALAAFVAQLADTRDQGDIRLTQRTISIARSVLATGTATPPEVANLARQIRVQRMKVEYSRMSRDELEERVGDCA